MTYLQFLLVFVLPPIALLWLALRRAGPPFAGGLATRAAPAARALALMLTLALVYTTPWDNYLVSRGVWGYSPGRVWFTIGWVPIEEYLFFLLQPILTGLFLFLVARRLPATGGAGAGAAVAGAAFWAAATAAGLALLRVPGGLYLGLILAWASPVALLQWAVGGGQLVAHGRLVAVAVAVPTLYLWIADRVALALGIWWIAPEHTTGLTLAGLPVEEATFFLITNVIVVQGLVLFLALGRGRGWRWAS